MRKILYTLGCVLFSAVVFSSCEMRDELTGKNMKTSYGEVNLNIANPSAPGSRVDADNAGEVVGSFPEEDVNINNYTLKITDSKGAEVEGGGKVSEIGKDGNVSVSLLEGEYTLSAYNYDGSNVSVSERPYFLGTNKVNVQAGVDVETEVVCKLNNIQIVLEVDDQFITKFNDDYEFTVDNGEGAVQKYTKDNIGKKYYFKIPQSKNYITVTSKATLKSGIGAENEGQTIIKTFKVTKPADAEGNSNLLPADAFTINIKDEGNSSTYISIGMTVDFSFTEKNETITVPVEDIVFKEEPTDPEPGPDPSGAITFEGLPAEYTDPDGKTPVVVTINAKNGIKNLNVKISSTNKDFEEIIATMQLTQFDLVNPEEGGQKNELINLGLYNPEDPIEGKTEYTFDVTAFMAFLPGFGQSVNTFSIEVVDAQGNKNGGDLKVTITKGL